jgi:hypothetical protein
MADRKDSEGKGPPATPTTSKGGGKGGSAKGGAAKGGSK